MRAWIIAIMNQFGYLGILLLIAIENLFPPIPSEVILTFGGFITTTTALTVWGVIIVSTLGSIVGALILYGIGRLLPAEKLERLATGKVGRMLHFKAGDMLAARQKFEKKGQSTVFFCRMVPVIRSLISIPAGMAGMGMFRFLVFTTLGSLIWNTLLVMLGASAGASWPSIVEFFDTYSTITLVIIGVAIIILCVVFYRKRSVPKTGT